MKEWFYKKVGLEVSLEKGKSNFLNRINQLLFKSIHDLGSVRYENIVKSLCLALGDNSDKYKQWDYAGYRIYKPLEYITNRNFKYTLVVIQELYLLYNIPKDRFTQIVELCLELSRTKDWIDLWIRFINGEFYEIWDEDLDKNILEESLKNMQDYKAKNDWAKCLQHYGKGEYNDCLSDCLTALEWLSKQILNNKKWLKENKSLILAYFWGSDSFSNEWKGIINRLYDYFNLYAQRHGNDEREKIDALEVEATLYLTGLIMNLLIVKDKALK